MFAASLLLGTTILGFAAWLEWRERESGDAAQGFEEDYLRRRRRGRSAIHIMLAIAGVFVIAAGFAGRGLVWVALWSAVCGLLLLVVAVAMLDLWRSNRYLHRKLPEMRRQALGPSSPSERKTHSDGETRSKSASAGKSSDS